MQNCQIEGFDLNQLTFSPFEIEEDDFSFEEPPQDIEYSCDELFYFSTCGSKLQNQDQFDYVINQNFILLGVYDGHGGPAVALHLKQNLLKMIVVSNSFAFDPKSTIVQCIEKIEQQILMDLTHQFANSGSSISILLCNQHGLLSVSVGDVLGFGIYQQNICGNRMGRIFSSQLNNEHNLENEEQRNNVRKRGGLIFKRGQTYRVSGELNLSRSIGDKKYKKFITAKPEVNSYKNDQFSHLVLMSDGFSKRFTKEMKNNTFQSFGLKDLGLFVEKNKHIKDNGTIVAVRNPFFNCI